MSIWGGFYDAIISKEDFLLEELPKEKKELLYDLQDIEASVYFKNAIRKAHFFTKSEADFLNSPFLDELRNLPLEGGISDNTEVTKFLFDKQYKLQNTDIQKIFSSSRTKIARFLFEQKYIEDKHKNTVITTAYEKGNLNMINLIGDYGLSPSIEIFPLIQVYDMDFRLEMLVMYITISKLQLWEKLRTDINSVRVAILSHPDVEKCGHSGYTEYVCLTLMKQISQEGIKK